MNRATNVRAALLCGMIVLVGAAPALADESVPTLRPRVQFTTDMGDIVIRLNAEVTPLSVLNFLQYAEDGYYNDTIFHRVKDNLIQGGGYTSDLQPKSRGLRATIPNESGRGLRNVRATVALYRNPIDHGSAQTQFFINLKDNPVLDRLRDGLGYAVIGEVIEGMDVVEKIAAVKVGANPAYAAGRSAVVPVDPISIRSAKALDRLDKTKALEIAIDFEERAKNPLAFAIREIENRHGTQAEKTDSGLVVFDVVDGTGAFPVDENTVEIDFTAYLLGSTVAFDSATQRWGRPGKVVLKGLLPGLREAIGDMREGGRRIAIVPPAQAFGEAGMPGKVPPNTTVIYDIKLLGASDDEPD